MGHKLTQTDVAAAPTATHNDAEQFEAAQARIKRLTVCIQNVDGLASHALGGIASIAHLAALAMESPAAFRHPERLARAFLCIQNLATDVADSIAFEFEQVELTAALPKDERERARAVAFGLYRREHGI